MMSQLKHLTLATLVMAGALAAGANQAQAASSCPALPNAESTFAGALNKLIDKATGKGNALQTAGDPVRQLNATQRQKVLSWLRGELAGRRAALSGSREKSAAEQKVDALKRRIFTRDRMERDASVVGGRIYDRTTDGTILPSARRGKPLGQLIDEEMARDAPSLAAKYKAKYKTAILKAIEENPAAVGEFAGALSGGDYMAVADQAASWGAQGFGTIVSDALEEMGHVNSKTVWDRAVKHAGAARQIVQALSNGRTDDAWKVIGDEWKKEVKEQSRAALKAAVNFAFDAGGGAGTVGDFVPIPGAAQNVIAPGAFGLTPGDLYLKLIDAEVALIKWGDNFLRTSWSHGDGQCVRIYNSTYERTGNTGAAYDEFHHCSATARYSAMFEFANQAKAMGIDETAAAKEFLEAHRRRLPNSGTPLQWIKAKAAKIAAKRKAVGRQIAPELTGVQKVLSNIARGIGSAMDNRLAEMVSAVLNEAQWDQLAEEIRQLEETLNDTLAAVDKDLNRIRRYSGGIDRWCTTYDRQKLIARQALTDGIDLSVRASRLRERLDGIDTSVCEGAETTAPGGDTAAQAATLAGAIKGDQAALSSSVDMVCAAPEGIRTAPDKATGRSRLGEALTTAQEAQAIIVRLKASIAEGSTLESGGTSDGQDQSSAAAAREQAMSEIAATKGEADALAGEFGNLEERFRTAHDAMRDAQRRIGNIAEPTQEIIEGIKQCLRPLAFAPVAEKPRAILAELEQLSSRNIGCRGDVLESWNERDADPPSGSGVSSSAAWRYRSLTVSPTPDTLSARLAEIEATCPVPADTSVPENSAAQSDLPDPETVNAEASDAGARVEHCVADALVAYQDAWGEPRVELSDATCSPSQNAEIMSKLNQAAADGSQAAKDHVAKLTPIVAAVSNAHAAYDTAKQAYAAGQLANVRSNLNGAKAAIDGLGGKPDCSDLAGKIASGLDKADRLDEVLREIGNAVSSCNVAAIERVRQRYGNQSHPAITSALRTGDGIIAANASYEDAKRTYSSGDLGSAESSLSRARSALSQAGGAKCSDLRDKIAGGLSRVERLRDAIRSAEQAVSSCDQPAIKRWTGSLATVTNPAADPVKAKLKRAGKKCESQAVATRNERCRRDHGPGYHAGKPGADGTYYCIPSRKTADNWCNANNKGSGWRAGKINAKGGFDCEKSRKQQQAENNAYCRRQHGRGYYAGKPRKDGTYYCRPTKKTASAWCRANNPGSGWYAGKIKANGGFNCYQSAKGRSRQAWADCRRQFGNRLVNVKIFKDGRYQCIYNTGTAGQQPRHNTQTSAAAAAAAGAIIQGIIGATGNRDRNRPPRIGGQQRRPGSTQTPRRTQRPPKCITHEKRTSTKWLNKTDMRCKGISF